MQSACKYSTVSPTERFHQDEPIQQQRVLRIHLLGQRDVCVREEDGVYKVSTSHQAASRWASHEYYTALLPGSKPRAPINTSYSSHTPEPSR
jgi:hypothetical protein